jgi:hypothetical protein
MKISYREVTRAGSSAETGPSYTGSTPVLGTGRLGSIPSGPTSWYAILNVMGKKSAYGRTGSAEILIIVLVIVVVFAAAWFYFDRGRNTPVSTSGVSQPSGAVSSTTNTTTSTPSNTATNIPATPAGTPLPPPVQTQTQTSLALAASQYNLIYPTGTAAQKLGNSGNQFKIQYVAVTTVKSPGGSSGQYPFFNQYFFNPQGNEFWDYGFVSADGSGYLKVVGLSMDLYGSFPELGMTYPVADSDTGATDFVAAQSMLPDSGEFTFTAVGSIHPTGRMAFVVPTEATETILNYPGGELTIDLQDQTITATPLPGPALQLEPVTVTAQPLSLYSQNIETYTDPSGAFSIQYPGVFAADNTVDGGGGSYLDSALVNISDPYSPGLVISPVVNGNISGMYIEYASPGDSGTCENPGNEASNGQVPPTIINNTAWYKATLLSNNGTPTGGQQGIDDVYQTLQGGNCWAVDFNWTAASGEAPSYNVVNIFEEAVLGTFRVLNAKALPSTSNEADAAGND